METTKDAQQLQYIEELKIIGEDILKNNKLLFYYSFKQNSLNNMIRCVELKYAIAILQNNKDLNFIEFINLFKSKLATLANFKLDIINPLKINLLFQIFSYINIKDLLPIFADNNIPLRRIRNSVMHGTFFISHEGTVYFYDCETKTKKEDDLTFIYSMPLDKIIDIYTKICEFSLNPDDAYSK